MAKITNTRHLGLRYLRTKSELSSQDLGDLIGVSAVQYLKKEAGTQPFYLSECILIQDKINSTLEADYSLDDIFLKDLTPES